MIAVVEDEKELCESLKMLLTEKGYEIVTARSCDEADKYIGNPQIDMFLLDVKLPDGSGFDICRKIRKSSEVPVIFLTSCDNEDEIVTGLDIGADDYITKPFSVRELMARVKANLRKAEIQVQSTDAIEEPKKESILIEVGELSINIEKFEVKVRGKVIDLTLREFEVLKYLANQPGQVVTRETLLEKVWGYEYYGDIRTVDVTVRRIREKIETPWRNLARGKTCITSYIRRPPCS